MTETWDVIIVGAGSSGSTVAGRLSEDPSLRVLLIEAGPPDDSPMIRLPKGLATLVSDPNRAYFYPAQRVGAAANGQPEIILRGKGLGGSSSVNGMVYHRGQPQDFDDWEELGLPGWGWKDILPVYMGMEDNPLPPNEWRGRGGPVPLRVAKRLPPLAEAVIAAAEDMGLPRKEEPNLPQQMGIGPTMENIDRRSRRVSSAHAFLPPEARRRPNLRILTNCRVDRILFEGKRAVGVRCTRGGREEVYNAAKSIVLSAGALETPRILQISGVGPAGHLKNLGVETLLDLPGVGANYRDHLCFIGPWQLRHQRDSENREFSGWRLIRNVLRYYSLRNGPMSTGAAQLTIFPEVLPGKTGRADAEFVWGPYTLSSRPTEGGQTVPDKFPGCTFTGFPLRGTSEGSVMAQSADPSVQPVIRPNYLATDYDRAVMVGLVRFSKALMGHERLKPFVAHEAPETAALHSDDEIIDFVMRTGISAQHGCGTCRMGPDGDPMAVLDEKLAVRGIQGLRVADCSIMPMQVSANTNGPAMMIGWKLADMMKAELAAAK